MGKYLIDNNVISGYLSKIYSPSGMDFISNVINEVPQISVITEIEALSWINIDKEKEQIIKEFVKDSKVFSLTDDIVKECVKLRRSRKIKIPDAIIASTAISKKLILISGDKDFNNIPDLKWINPHTL